jgi:hypothetical protein
VGKVRTGELKAGGGKLEAGSEKLEVVMNLKSEFDVACPCCQATLVVDANLRRVVRHEEPVRGDRPELSDAQRILAEEAARRESIFQQSVAAERTRGDALSKRFEEALRQARQEPITKPTRDFDLD